MKNYELSTTPSDEAFIRRCFDLARLGAGRVSPNPMVGAVLVHEGRIIGEGWHQRYGGPHAEVNALAAVPPEDRPLIPRSTLYVSLEPCCIHRKTPPCTDLILRHGIPRVVVSCLDPTPEVNGRGLELLRSQGVEVRRGVLEEAGRRLIRFREAYVRLGRPFVLLKFARSRDGFLGKPGEQIWISHPWTKRWVHRCRAAADAILVGTHTARTDNPQLTTRLFFGASPLRIVFDRRLTLPRNLHLFDRSVPTWVLNEQLEAEEENLRFVRLPFDEGLLPALLQELHRAECSFLIVEGGAFTLNQFIQGNWWDECCILEGEIEIGEGIPAPSVRGDSLGRKHIGRDELTILRNRTPAAVNVSLKS